MDGFRLIQLNFGRPGEAWLPESGEDTLVVRE